MTVILECLTGFNVELKIKLLGINFMVYRPTILAKWEKILNLTSQLHLQSKLGKAQHGSK